MVNMRRAEAENSIATVSFDAGWRTIEEIVAIAEKMAPVSLSAAPEFRAAIARGAEFVDRRLAEEGAIYGVTTGFGDSCTVAIQPELIAELPRHLYTFHGCGLGAHFTPNETRAVIATRLTSLCKGYSGVSVQLLEQLVRLLAEDILPAIPCEGSVGASGDLTPLSYLAAVLCGEGEVLRAGAVIAAAPALAEAAITPLRLRPKEALAIMNGTAVMTALACVAFVRAEYLTRLTTRISALASFALDGNAEHFDGTLFSVKPHPGQQSVAAWLREDLPIQQSAADGKRLQDRYSIRCAPHVIGVLADALPWLRSSIENELNSANDNPIIDSAGGRVLHGGHFYGGHIAFAMDSLKNAVANLADLLDRQMALLVDSRYSNGLAANLSGAEGPRAAINHGLKALQISVSAWTAEALKLTMPASVFSRSTECHNQDKVSMGTIAARDCSRVLELTEQVAAGLLITVRQAAWLRRRLNSSALPSPALQRMLDALGADIAVIDEDRRLEPDLRLLLERIRGRAWKLYDQEN
jgi:histidine ammonia-lyase